MTKYKCSICGYKYRSNAQKQWHMSNSMFLHLRFQHSVVYDEHIQPILDRFLEEVKDGDNNKTNNS